MQCISVSRSILMFYQWPLSPYMNLSLCLWCNPIHPPGVCILWMTIMNKGKQREAKSRLKILEKCQDRVKKILVTAIVIYFAFSFFKVFFIRNEWSVDLQNIDAIFQNVIQLYIHLHRCIWKIIFICLL